MLARAIESGSELPAASLDFALQMAERLDKFQERTFVSEKQLKWIEDIERALEGE